MTAVLNSTFRVAGSIKFHATVPVEKLAQFIADMKTVNPERWLDLHVRGAGDDGMHYLTFHYILPDGEKKTHRKVINRILQYLRDHLGTYPKQGKKSDLVPRGVKAWSIATVKVMA